MPDCKSLKSEYGLQQAIDIAEHVGLNCSYSSNSDANGELPGRLVDAVNTNEYDVWDTKWLKGREMYGIDVSCSVGTVPYDDLLTNFNTCLYQIYIEQSSYTESEKEVITKAIKNLGRKSGVIHYIIHEEKPTDGRRFLRIIKGQGCYSYLSRDDSKALSADGQPISIGRDCIKKGIIQHELIHARKH